MVKHYDIQYFTATVNGTENEVRCHTTETRNAIRPTDQYTG